MRQEAELATAVQRFFFFFKGMRISKRKKKEEKKGPVFAANTCNLLQPLSDKTVLP